MIQTRMVSLLAAAAVAVGCSSSTPAPEPVPRATEPAPVTPAPAPAPEVTELEAETELASPAGASFSAPQGWFVTRTGDYLLLEPPERDLQLWMVDIQGMGAEEAIAAAWARVRPDFSMEVDDILAPPAQGGWDEVRQIAYQTPVAAARAVFGIARRKGEVSYVLLIDGPAAALQRRGAQLGEIIGSQKPAGLDDESFAGATAAPLDQARAAELEAFIEESMKTLQIPGTAVAVVQGGKVVFERGYGVRGGSKGKARGAVTPDTRFMIGSTTKSLTSLMMAVLVDEKVFAWTTPVTELLPSFALGDPEVTGKLQMQHTVCACTGLPRQDMEFLFEYHGLGPEQRIDELATMKPTTGFGETFQYSNALVSAGGYAAARAASKKKALIDAYTSTLERTVLKPLGMKATTFSMAAATRAEHALPHGQEIDGSFHSVPLAYEDAVLSVAPAGGAWSTVRDLARYIQLELAGGSLPGGKRLVSEEQLMERREPRVKIDDDSFYGLALMISRDRDLVKVGHGGNTLGFTTTMVFFPEHDFGLAVLTNAQGANSFNGAIERKLIELLLGGRPEAAEDVAFVAARKTQVAQQELPKIADPPEAAWIDPLLGSYRNDALGTLTIVREGEAIMVDAGEWKVRAGSYQAAGPRVLMTVGAPLAGVVLLPKPDGTLMLDAGQQQYVFTPVE